MMGRTQTERTRSRLPSATEEESSEVLIASHKMKAAQPEHEFRDRDHLAPPRLRSFLTESLDGLPGYTGRSQIEIGVKAGETPVSVSCQGNPPFYRPAIKKPMKARAARCTTVKRNSL
jgi:hypothetical protein